MIARIAALGVALALVVAPLEAATIYNFENVGFTWRQDGDGAGAKDITIQEGDSVKVLPLDLTFVQAV